MARAFTSLSRKDLKFIAEDIGPQLVPFLKPEDIVKAMDAKQQFRLFVCLLEEFAKDGRLENWLADLPAETYQHLMALLLRIQSATATGQRKAE